MRLEPDVEVTPRPGPLDDALAGVACVAFVEGDTQVCVGWLRSGGEGLMVTARVDDGVVGETRFWCDAQQWCDWLAPSLPVPSWDALPPAWQASAASLTLAVSEERTDTLSDTAGGARGEGRAGRAASEESEESEGSEGSEGCEGGEGTVWGVGDAGNAGNAGNAGDTERAGNGAYVTDATDAASDTASWPRATAVAPAQVDTAWRVGMVLRRDGRRLVLMYVDGATSWLRERCRRATPRDTALDPSGLPARRCALVAGWATLPRAQCERLQVGDAVLLDVAADIASGEYWLVDGDRAIAMRGGSPLDHRVVHLDGTDADPSGDTVSTGAASHPEAVIVRLAALVAERQFPIPWLTAWRSGNDAVSQSEATACALPADRITLQRDDAPWATGRLLRFEDGGLAVCIDGMIGAPTADGAIDAAPPEHGMPICDDFPSDISGRDRMGVHSETT